MHLAPSHRRCPRAGIDPITDAASALLTVSMALHRPLRDETIVVLLDDARCGVAIVVVAGTDEPDSLIEVVEFLASPAAHGGAVASMILASVRPDTDGLLDGDIDRWLEVSDLAEQAGVEVVEWFVIGNEAASPRDAFGEPPRW